MLSVFIIPIVITCIIFQQDNTACLFISKKCNGSCKTIFARFAKNKFFSPRCQSFLFPLLILLKERDNGYFQLLSILPHHLQLYNQEKIQKRGGNPPFPRILRVFSPLFPYLLSTSERTQKEKRPYKDPLLCLIISNFSYYIETSPPPLNIKRKRRRRKRRGP